MTDARRHGPGRLTLIYDVAESDAPNIATIERLARLQLCARRRGFRLQLQNPPTVLRDLICFLGLEEALPTVRRGDENA